MNTVKLWALYTRDFIVSNFMVETKAIKYNNELVYFEKLKQIFYYIFKLLPFGFVKIILGLFNIKIIYKIDSIYNITNNEHNHIVPIILNFNFIKNNNGEEIINNFSSKIKYYGSNIPLSFIIKEHQLESYTNIKLKYLNKGKLVDKQSVINDYINLPIYKLFEN